MSIWRRNFFSKTSILLEHQTACE